MNLNGLSANLLITIKRAYPTNTSTTAIPIAIGSSRMSWGWIAWITGRGFMIKVTSKDSTSYEVGLGVNAVIVGVGASFGFEHVFDTQTKIKPTNQEDKLK